MGKYEVRDVVCDYGVFENGEMVLICNSRRNALLIKAIMEKDCNASDFATGDYNFNSKDFEAFLEENNLAE